MYTCVNDYISYVEMRRKPNKTKDKKKKKRTKPETDEDSS